MRQRTVPFQLAQDARRQLLAELHAPLIERVDAPHCALREHRMFIQRHQLPQHLGRQHLRQDHVGRPVPLEHLVRHQLLGHAFRPYLLRGLAERQRLGLREDIGHQHVMMPPQRIERLEEADEIARNQPRPLVNQLVKRVLSVGPRLAPVDRPGVRGHLRPIQRHMLPV